MMRKFGESKTLPKFFQSLEYTITNRVDYNKIGGPLLLLIKVE